jgi:60 kDa SS-A/Ro ribonucleoprotein
MPHQTNPFSNMAKFNAPAVGTKTVNQAGGVAYQQTPELELASLLLTSFVKAEAYRTEADVLARVKELIGKCDKLFVAKAAVYARNEYGMRSISHVVASELAKFAAGQDWAKNFYAAVVRRPDDITEILAYHTANNGKVPNAMRKGLAMSFDKFDGYSLAKYRGEGHAYTLVDAANVLHPKPVERNAEALAQLMRGELKSVDTWESKLSAAGQGASEDEKIENKREVWVDLITSGKIGYFALLRNLRNIIEQAPEVIGAACRLLTDDKLIKKSLVLPFRFLTAYDELAKLGGNSAVRDVLVALNRAVDISLSNLPDFGGKSLVVLDVSGSMMQQPTNPQPAKIGALFAAVLAKATNADIMVFANDAQYHSYNPMDTTMTIANSLRFGGGGTNFGSIFQRATGKYDRVFLLSDMQGWMVSVNTLMGQATSSPVPTYNQYCKVTGANPFIYSFDLTGGGTTQFPTDRVFCIAGYSDKVLALLPKLEQDKHALVNVIKAVTF